MATLFERLIGLNLPDNPALDSVKMPIHGFDGCMNFINSGVTVPGYGNITGVEVAGWFNLDSPQQQQMIYLNDLIEDAKDAGAREAFQRSNKDYWYNGEWNTAAQWQDETAYWATLAQIITDAGGTPTPKPF
jgi:hypothetical protein